VKEQRQVIVVTHNANIAVLGDAELLLGMERTGGCGEVNSRGAIDDSNTKNAVATSLEGGEAAFRRRAEMYGIRLHI
jgi:DNA repair ATPase RecN